jgi:hypothetical protein
VSVSVKALASDRPPALKGEQSTEKAFWQPLQGLKADSPAAFSLTLPARSVTTLAASMQVDRKP